MTISLDSKAKELINAGESVIHFGIGEADYLPPAQVIEKAHISVDNHQFYKYGPAPGYMPLRKEIARVANKNTGSTWTENNVIVTNGGKHAIFAAFFGLIEEGDEVLLPAPYWTTYPESISIAGGVSVEVHTKFEDGFDLKVEDLEAALTPKTKGLVFVSPNNPTGVTYSKETVRNVAKWAHEKGLWILTDEIYEYLVFDEDEYESIIKAYPKAQENTVIVNGISKSLGLTGWRVGWIIAPDVLAKALTKFQSHVTSNINNVAQAAVLESVDIPEDYHKANIELCKARAEMMYEALRSLPDVKVLKPTGALYCFPDFSKWVGKTIDGVEIRDSLHLAELFLEKIKVVVVPGEAFSSPGFLRFTYATTVEELEEGMRRVRQLLEENL